MVERAGIGPDPGGGRRDRSLVPRYAGFGPHGRHGRSSYVDANPSPCEPHAIAEPHSEPVPVSDTNLDAYAHTYHHANGHTTTAHGHANADPNAVSDDES